MIPFFRKIRRVLIDQRQLGRKEFGEFFTDKRVINGFLMLLIEFSTMNQQLKEMKSMSEQLMGTIEREMGRT